MFCQKKVEQNTVEEGNFHQFLRKIFKRMESLHKKYLFCKKPNSSKTILSFFFLKDTNIKDQAVKKH